MRHTGVNTAAQLATAFHDRFRIVLIEKNSHFQHLFAFPRFAVATGVDTQKAFIPFVPGAFAGCPPGSGIVVQASATGLTESAVQLDRKVEFAGQQLRSIPYSYLVSLARSTLFDVFETNAPQGHRDGHEINSAIHTARLLKARRCDLPPKARPKGGSQLEDCDHWRRRSWCSNGHRYQGAVSREIRHTCALPHEIDEQIQLCPP
jgi:hypothetical protein